MAGQDAGHSGTGQGGFVLISKASRPPAVNAATHDHGARRPSDSDAALAQQPIASSASKTGEPCGSGNRSAPSSARAQHRK
jgi:hypothetical protein